jgi:hypothetical protein
VHMFISRLELLPEDEMTNEHDAAKRAEALQIEPTKDLEEKDCSKELSRIYCSHFA